MINRYVLYIIYSYVRIDLDNWRAERCSESKERVGEWWGKEKGVKGKIKERGAKRGRV